MIVAEFAYEFTLPDDSTAKEPCVFVMRVRDGRIIESRDCIDPIRTYTARGMGAGDAVPLEVLLRSASQSASRCGSGPEPAEFHDKPTAAPLPHRIGLRRAPGRQSLRPDAVSRVFAPLV
ncbi:hypothetical protein [Streptomyces sp. GbtcB6]|uniref:hypothetical protein n=1 Tax=Streptomyces sp. GbtcB6 TaxID=2824751 RepID=UPI001C306574|nr:hypothetical protein [Streptomyces sp. GbtcB6]